MTETVIFHEIVWKEVDISLVIPFTERSTTGNAMATETWVQYQTVMKN